MPGKKRQEYDPEPFQRLIRESLEQTGESYFKASEAAGLHGSTLSKYLSKDWPIRPMRDACIGLADHFGVNPNMLLEAAGYAPLDIFDTYWAAKRKVGPRETRVAIMLAEVEEPEEYDRLLITFESLIRAYRFRKEVAEQPD